MDDSGAVTGVEAVDAQGARRTFTGTVVLASGGYQGNAELMARYHGPLGMLARPVARGGNYNKGEGIEMAMAIGAATAGNFALFHAEPVDPRSPDPEAAIMAFTYGILVNVDGERFVDEARGPIDAWYERTTRDIQAQPRGIAWMILDAEGQAIPNLKTAIRSEESPVRADTIAELAARHRGGPGHAGGHSRRLQRRLPRWRVGPDPTRRARDRWRHATEVQLGQADPDRPVHRLPGHVRQRVHLRRTQGRRDVAGHRPRRTRHPRPLRRG